MKTKRLSQWMLGVAIASALSLSCSSGLQNYTQITLASQSETELDTDTLEATEAVLAERLTNLGIEEAEILSGQDNPDHILIRLPADVDAEATADVFANTGQLSLRAQKPDTEDALAANIETLQRLLVEQDTLKQTNKSTEAKALQPQINELRADIIELYEPTELTGELISDAQAVLMSGFNTWEISVWFNDEGAEKFAQQTQAIAGTGRTIGIFIDDVLLSTPTVDVAYAEAGIKGGQAIISGNFTAEAAKALEAQLKSGALPIELEMVDIEVVSSEYSALPNEKNRL
jgi:preprotein translocase subunit SecD